MSKSNENFIETLNALADFCHQFTKDINSRADLAITVERIREAALARYGRPYDYYLADVVGRYWWPQRQNWWREASEASIYHTSPWFNKDQLAWLKADLTIGPFAD